MGRLLFSLIGPDDLDFISDRVMECLTHHAMTEQIFLSAPDSREVRNCPSRRFRSPTRFLLRRLRE